jgi:hypothetical protein
MSILDKKNYIQMTMDFEKAVIFALLLSFQKKSQKEKVGSSINQLLKNICAYPKKYFPLQ